MGPLKTEESPEAGPQLSPTLGLDRRAPRRRWWLWLLIIAVLGYGGWRLRGASASRQAPNVGAGGGARSANLSVPVVVAVAQRGDLPVYFNGLGSVAALNTVTVRSRVDGQLVNVAFREGQFVRQGDLLAQIDPRPFQVQLEQAEGQLAKDRAQLHDAQVNYERFSTLYKEGVISKQQRDTQEAQVGQLEGAIQADQGQIDNAKLQLTYSRITAPLSGRIGLRLIDPGNIVHANDPNGLLIITQLQPIAVLFSLPQDQLPEVYKKLRSGAPLTVEAFARDDTTKIGAGKLLTIDNQIDPSTGTYKLKAVFNNDDNSLFPNQFVNVHLLVDTKRGLTLVPAVAIQRGPQGTYVYVVANGNAAKIRPVTVALLSGNTAGISSGLEPNETVVIDGQDKLQDGSNVEPRAPPGSVSPPGGKTK